MFSPTDLPRIVRTQLLLPIITIDCHVDGIPPPTAMWVKNNVTVSNTELVTASFNSTTGIARLSFSPIAREFGTFICIASSDAGSVNSTFEIDLRGRYRFSTH